jgi:hypothetical protein
MVNYQLGKIYKIVSDQTDKIYVGSTCEPLLSKRLANHRASYKRYLQGEYDYVTSFEILKYDDAEIILLELFSCQNKDELHSRERHYIESILNTVNKNIPSRTSLEYYQANKNKIKEYCEKNKGKIKEYHKQYEEKNKEKIQKYKKEQYQKRKNALAEKVSCECGASIRKDKMNRHTKSLKHQNFLNNKL